MRIAESFGWGRPIFSFEFFPPRTDAGYRSLFTTIAELKKLDPTYVSVTWGAGGSTRQRTIELVSQIQREIGITAMAHVTCVGATRHDLQETLDRLVEAGIENVLALGGDMPEGAAIQQGDLRYGSDLAELIRAGGWPLCLGGGCYPETHPRAISPAHDLECLALKVRAGADFLITQLFFDPADYFAFVARARSAAIEAPIVPGVMPITSSASIRRMAALSGARIPETLVRQLDAAGDDDAQTLEIGVAWATQQCRELLEGGAPGIHFYTLNRSTATRDIYASLF
jgi:methylenetetrahydrofolate reductase (NADPH)